METEHFNSPSGPGEGTLSEKHRRRRYYVDWTDTGFPQILRAVPRGTGRELKTLADAQAEIIDHFQGVAKHAQAIIRQARATRAVDVMDEEL